MNDEGSINLFLSSPCKELTIPFAKKLGEMSKPFKVIYDDEEKDNKIYHYLMGQKSLELTEMFQCMKALTDEVTLLQVQMLGVREQLHGVTEQLHAANAEAKDTKFWAQTVFSSPLLTIHDACRVYLQALEKRAIQLLKVSDLWENYTQSKWTKMKLCGVYRYLHDEEELSEDVLSVKKNCLFVIHQQFPEISGFWMDEDMEIYELSSDSRNDQGYPIGRSLKDGVKMSIILDKIREMVNTNNLPSPFDNMKMKSLVEAALLYLSQVINEPTAAA